MAETITNVAVAVRFFAGAEEAAGTAAETVELPADATLGQLEAELVARHGQRLATVLKACAFLVGDDMTRDRDAAVGAEVDVLPPFAGG